METTVPCGAASMPRVGLGVWKVPKDITAATVVEVILAPAAVQPISHSYTLYRIFLSTRNH